MALTRSMLKGMNLTDEQVGAIIEEHTNVTSALKDKISEAEAKAEEFKEKAEQLDDVKKELETLKKDVKDNNWKGKYDKEHEEFEKYKSDIAEKESASKVKEAYKKLLDECKVGSKHIDSILRVTDFKDMKLKEDGTFNNLDALKKSIETDWSGFITTEGTKGAGVETPPGGSGKGGNETPSRAAELAAKYHDNLYGKGKEN